MASQLDVPALRMEVERESEMSKVMSQSVANWKLTCAELEKRISATGDDTTEWKIRYENQVELNKFLEERQGTLSNSIQKETEFIRRLKDGDTFEEDIPDDPLHWKKQVVRLSREIYNLDSQLKDLQWRLDQESKSYHKVDEKRKRILNDVSSARPRDAVEYEASRSKEAEEKAMKNVDKLLNARQIKESRVGGGSYAVRGQAMQARRASNIPQDKRIIEPGKGPVKKTAAVKRLPPL